MKIGNHNTIREKVIINRGTNTTDCTIVGNGNFLLEGVHLAHDTHLGNNCVLGILKHDCHVGSWALLKDGCRANKDVPPFIVAAHNPITYYGINAVILSKEKQLPETIIDDIAKAYRQIYQCSTSLENAIRRIKEIIPLNPEISYLIEFIENSKKGIIGVNM